MKLQYFNDTIRKILKEELDKNNIRNDTMSKRVPEMNADGIDPEKKNRRFGSDENSKDLKTKEGLLNDLTKLVNTINDNILVIWNDHDDLMVNARDLKFIRISPRWEDSYVIEMMTHNEDRIWVTGQTWEQVKTFVKNNLKDLNKQPTYVEKAYDKSYRNREDETPNPDKGLNQKNKQKFKPLTVKSLSSSKNKEKNYTEDQVKNDDDLPNKPMREVEDFKKLKDYKVQDPVKLRKRIPDTKLKVK